jgi:hypothetical protein
LPNLNIVSLAAASATIRNHHVLENNHSIVAGISGARHTKDGRTSQVQRRFIATPVESISSTSGGRLYARPALPGGKGGSASEQRNIRFDSPEPRICGRDRSVVGHRGGASNRSVEEQYELGE